MLICCHLTQTWAHLLHAWSDVDALTQLQMLRQHVHCGRLLSFYGPYERALCSARAAELCALHLPNSQAMLSG